MGRRPTGPTMVRPRPPTAPMDRRSATSRPERCRPIRPARSLSTTSCRRAKSRAAFRAPTRSARHNPRPIPARSRGQARNIALPMGRRRARSTPPSPGAAAAPAVSPPGARSSAGAAYPPANGPAPYAPSTAASPQYGAPDDVPRPPIEIDPARRQAIAALPPEEQPEAQPKELPPQLRRQLVDYATKEPAGTILIDTPNTYLYLVLGHGKAMRYGIGAGREGFTWAGVERVSKMTEWPDWYPPTEMIDRQPYLPRMMAGGPGNPLGARALYLGKSLYRIHGTNQPSTIGQFVSSGCIRLLNEDIEDLYGRVTVGTRVVVLPGSAPGPSAAAQPPVSPPQALPSVR